LSFHNRYLKLQTTLHIFLVNAEANETFLNKDKALVGRSLVQASKNVFVRVMNPSAETEIIYPGTIVAHVGGCFIGCAYPVAMLCFTTLVRP
jgi:hypothetical protein